MRTETLAPAVPAQSRARRLIAGIAATLRAVLRRSSIPHVDDLPPQIRRDIGLPPEVHRPTHAPPWIF